MFARHAALAFSLVLTMGSPASAQVSLGLVPVALEGELDPTLAPGFAEAIATGLEAQSIAVVPAPELARAAGVGEEALAGCTTASCLGGLCSRGHVHGVVRAVVAGSLNMYTLSLEALAPGGQRLASGERGCELCSLAEARTAMGELAAQVARDLPREGRAVLSVSPPDARVTVDGAPAAGPELRLGPGPHALVASADGYRPQERAVEVPLGGEVSVALSLEPLAERRRRARRFGPLGITGLVLTAVGVAGASASAAVLAIDGNCAGGRIDANGQCEFIYSTLGGGVSGLALGISGLVAGLVLIVVDLVRDPAPSHARAWPGLALGLDGGLAGRW